MCNKESQCLMKPEVVALGVKLLRSGSPLKIARLVQYGFSVRTL